MLQQILRDMRVAPEILAELDETQKQTLFCRMREEQVRRWRLWDQKLNKQEDTNSKNILTDKKTHQKKSVNFLTGEDGEPWVWIMGEHARDKTIEDIMEEEAQQKARSQALRETEQLRKSVERELSGLIHFNSPPMESIEKDCITSKRSEKIEDSMDIYCSVDELREKMKNLSPEIKPTEPVVNSPPETIDYTNSYQKSDNQNNLNYKNNITNFNLIEGRREIFKELNPSKGHKVSTRVALWERRVTEERACEILKGLRHRQAQALLEAEETARSQHLLWQEQERKAKEAEIQMRDIARKAREEHRRSAVISEKPQESPNSPSLDPSDICYTDPTVNLGEEMKPPSRDAITQWFIKSEISRGAGTDEAGKHAKWFHGLITRVEAETLLQECTVGSYLVRVSERIWGYAISYRAAQRCKHYLVDASQDSHYQFLGANQITHKTLANLVSYHTKNFITEAGKEMLLLPCEINSIPQIMASCAS